MKITALTLFMLAGLTTAFSQTNTFRTLGEKFADEQMMFSFKTSGVFTRTILSLAGEHSVKRALRDVRKVRVIAIPAGAFRHKKVTLEGFKKFASEQDSFEEIVRVRDSGDDITVLMKKGAREKDYRYLFLIHADREIVVAEVKGYIDHKRLFRDSRHVTFTESSL